jgi:hypothetical protein
MADSEAYGVGKGVSERAKAIQELNPRPKVSTPAPVRKAGPPAKMDLVNKGKKAGYGSRPGEKRIDVTNMLKPLKKGTARVKKTGARVVHKGEAVLTAKQAKKLRKQGKLRGKKVKLNQMQKLGRIAPRKVHAPVKRHKKGRGKRG